MPLQGGPKKAAKAGGVAGATVCLLTAWLSATTPNVAIVGATVVIVVVVLVVGVFKLLDRYLGFLEGGIRRESTKKRAKKGKKDAKSSK